MQSNRQNNQGSITKPIDPRNIVIESPKNPDSAFNTSTVPVENAEKSRNTTAKLHEVVNVPNLDKVLPLDPKSFPNPPNSKGVPATIANLLYMLNSYGINARGVLTLQGPQGTGKTSWIKALIDDPTPREVCLKLDHHLDASNKEL